MTLGGSRPKHESVRYQFNSLKIEWSSIFLILKIVVMVTPNSPVMR